MPVHKAAYKTLRRDKKRRLRNMRVKSELKTLNKKFNILLDDKKIEEAKSLLHTLISKLGKASAKGIIHTNKASRKISRLNKQLNRIIGTVSPQK